MAPSPHQYLQALSKKVAGQLPQPLFYRTFGEDIRRSEDILLNHGMVRECRAHLDESLLECAHGLCHCESVARDAGAIVLIEGRQHSMFSDELGRLAEAAVIAGLLHDIKRREEDHAVRGSIEAQRILSSIGMDSRLREYVVYAIRNHEAFKQTCDLGDEAGCMISDALYDADKFRWGPENFTTTLWIMVDDRGMTPERLHGVFQEKMKGIERIKETFRTGTGKTYGPEIIDQGITIGKRIFAELSTILGASP